jgi:hypothetical protein
MNKIEINHEEYQKTLQSKNIAELRFIIKDAHEAERAMPNGPKAGYYLDEISYASMELAKRARIAEENWKLQEMEEEAI